MDQNMDWLQRWGQVRSSGDVHLATAGTFGRQELPGRAGLPEAPRAEYCKGRYHAVIGQSGMHAGHSLSHAVLR